jgi:PAS domain S-box-containing protein
MEEELSDIDSVQWLSEEQQQRAFRDGWNALERHLAVVVPHVVRHAMAQPELAAVLGDLSTAQIERRCEELLHFLRRGCMGEWASSEALLRRFGAACSSAKVRFSNLHEIAARVRDQLVVRLVADAAGDAERLAANIGVLQRLLDRALAIIREEYVRAREQLVRARRAETEQALLLSERRFARLSESGLLGILVCDLLGDTKDANDAFLSMVGYTREEMLSGQMRWADLTPPEWQHLDEEAVEQLKERGFTRTWEKEYWRKDGSRLPILVGVAMLNDCECIAFVLDITERRRFEELRGRSVELEAQNLRIQEANRLKSEFLANMSHELRTPLNSIIGFADILFDGEVPADSPKHREFIGHILRSGRHLLQLINDVLDLAKVEAGKLEFRPESVDLSQVAAEVMTILRSTAAAKQTPILLDIEPSINEVVLDPSRLKQVLYNYVSNALKFTPEGGRVVVRARADSPDFVRIEVEDTGIGIAPKDLHRLFVEFQQLDSGAAKKHAGTGLGLSLTRRIVEAQGGNVGVDSVQGKGSTFFAVLPRQAAPRARTSPPVSALTAPEHGTSVLIVEDDDRDRAFLVQTLHRAGYGVETAATGDAALSSCARRTFDAVTLDLLLPDMTGLEVLHRIRKEGKNRRTPVVVVSVAAEQGVVGGFLVHDYLKKPTTSEELLESLKRAAIVPSANNPILVVDDDPAARNLMQTLLVQFGYRVECRADGASALDVVSKQRPLAVVLDLLMPGVDGFEFLARFREQPGNRMVPVIVWTVKDLTLEDHTRLHTLAHSVIAKGQAKPAALVDELHTLLQY